VLTGNPRRKLAEGQTRCAPRSRRLVRR
jgi:hypothetical protein